ncbi:hypothetical protein JVU11DRAFT_118 [Chiua virens]|nr:hypothetical protein JVU11DRAFT_118 [Chiua virens]
MVRSSQSTTFSASTYFDDRGPHGTAQPITEYVNPHSRPIVSYFFPKGVGEYHYGERHPMKPHRLTLTNALVMGYGLDKQIHHIYNPRPATQAELEMYHDHDYIDFLSRKLCSGACDTAINWSGGLHHAKRGEASGFCYVNDIVLAILELLRHHPRVLYIDIDIHHGDGVELAFYHSNRVMTVSFHKYTGEFFPGTGKLDDNGANLGKHFCLNVPLQDGVDDEMYLTVFKTVIEDTVTTFRPTAIVLQCGADSLGCDRLGAFNLSIAAHGECVNFVRKFNVPLLVLGGGGYTIKNVSRCWTYETAVLVGAEIPDELPATVYDSFFRDSEWKLHPPLTGRVENQNSPGSLQKITIGIRNKLRYLQGAPSVAMQEIPPDLEGLLADEEKTGEEKDEELGTAMAGERRSDRTMARNEYFDGENDVDPEPCSSASARRPGSARRSRGAGRRARGRGRSRVSAATAKEEGDEGDENEMASTPKVAKPRSRKPRKPRGRAVTDKDKEKDKDKDLTDVDLDATAEPESGQEPMTPMDPDLDIS